MLSLLAIDTAGPEIGVALSHQGQVFTWSDRVGRGSESALGQAVADMLEKIDGLNGIVVTVGPGAFTSLRVGVATALGLALASDCPVLPICSLKARALGESGRVLSLLDGRKGRAYAAVFEDEEQVGEAVDWAPERAIEMAGEHAFTAVGEGAEVWRDLLPGWAQIRSAPGKSPVTQMLRYYEQHSTQAVDPEAVSLRYLRDPDAKLPKGAPQQGA